MDKKNVVSGGGKDFDQYAQSIFGNTAGKKHLHAVGLPSGWQGDEMDIVPPPFNVSKVSSDSKGNDHYVPDLGPEVTEKRRKLMNKEDVKDASTDDNVLFFIEPSRKPDIDSENENDLTYFCMDHMKICSSRASRREHIKCNVSNSLDESDMVTSTPVLHDVNCDIPHVKDSLSPKSKSSKHYKTHAVLEDKNGDVKKEKHKSGKSPQNNLINVASLTDINQSSDKTGTKVKSDQKKTSKDDKKNNSGNDIPAKVSKKEKEPKRGRSEKKERENSMTKDIFTLDDLIQENVTKDKFDMKTKEKKKDKKDEASREKHADGLDKSSKGKPKTKKEHENKEKSASGKKHGDSKKTDKSKKEKDKGKTKEGNISSSEKSKPDNKKDSNETKHGQKQIAGNEKNKSNKKQNKEKNETLEHSLPKKDKDYKKEKKKSKQESSSIEEDGPTDDNTILSSNLTGQNKNEQDNIAIHTEKTPQIPLVSKQSRFRLFRKLSDEHSSSPRTYRRFQYDRLSDGQGSTYSSPISSRSSVFGSSNASFVDTFDLMSVATSKETLQNLYNYAGKIIEDRVNMRQYLCVRKQEVIDEVNELMENMFDNFLTIKAEFLARFKGFHEENTTLVSRQKTSCHKLRHDSRIVWQSLQVNEDFNDFEKYQAIISESSKDAKNLEALTRNLVEQAPCFQYEIRYTEETKAFLELMYVGHVATREETPMLPPFMSTDATGSEGEDETTMLERVPCTDEDVTRCCFTGCTYVSPEDVLLVDSFNGLIKRVNKMGLVCDRLSMEKCPWDTTSICLGKVAVTVPKMQAVYFVECEPHLHIVGHFKTRSECFGICKIRDFFVITCDPWSKDSSLRVYSEHGQLLYNIQPTYMGQRILRCPLHITTDFFNVVIYVSDSSSDCVYALTLEGEMKFIYENVELSYPTGVATDRNNYLYICGKDSANIHKVNNKGELKEVLLKRVDEIRRPRAICFHPYGNNMVITDLDSYNSTIFYKTNLK